MPLTVRTVRDSDKPLGECEMEFTQKPTRVSDAVLAKPYPEPKASGSKRTVRDTLLANPNLRCSEGKKPVGTTGAKQPPPPNPGDSAPPGPAGIASATEINA